MTLVAAKRFDTSIRKQDSRESCSLDNARNATQLAQLHGVANLTDWKSIYADIQLMPSSCIDHYHSLVVLGNSIQLQPTDAASLHLYAPADTGALATRHLAGKLSLRCRKLQTETSPANQSTRYNLYLAAGFAVYQKNGETQRTPVLLIPITINRSRGRGSAYSIKYQTGQLLRVNPHIADLCSTHIDQLIKPFSDTTDLREFLRSIKAKIHQNIDCKITANTGILRLPSGLLGEFSKAEIVDNELRRTKPGIEFKPLPATPKAFDPQLAIRILRFIDEKELPIALRNLAGVVEEKHTPVFDIEPNLDDEAFEKYHNCASWLIDVGLGHWKLKNIAMLPKRVETMVASINSLLSNNLYQKHFRPEYKTVEMLLRLNRSKDNILNSPPEMQHHAISQHADADTPMLLQKAKIQAASLEHELEVIEDTFHMGAIPSSASLNKLIETISKREEESQLTNPNYFRARKTLNEILKYHNGVLTDHDLKRLDSLVKTLQFAEVFSDDPYYKRHFGSLFKGTHTNWQRLDSVVNYVGSLSQDLGSPLLVAQFADQWVSFKRDFGDIEPKLESAASSAHRLCSLIPMYINHSTRLEHAISTAEKLRTRVDTWQKYLHKNYADTELTPFQLLSTFDLGELNPPTLLLSQFEIDERVYRHIVGTGCSPETVTATSEWLSNTVVRLQNDTPTVRRFLDKEAELLSNLA